MKNYTSIILAYARIHFKKNLLILSSFLILTSTIKPAIEEVILKINNLNCPECSKKLAQNIVKIPAIKSVTINEENSNMSLKIEPTLNLDINNLQAIVEKNSCKPIKFKIIASGIILQKNNYLVLYCKNSSQDIYLAEVKPNNNKEENKNENIKEKVKTFGKNLWSKTKNICKNLTAEGKFESDLKKFSQNNTPIYFQGNVKTDENGKIWLTKKKHASIKDLACKKAENLTLAFR